MSEFTKQDAEDAGWVIVHEGIDEEVEGATLNASHWRAEKYLNVPGRAGAFVEVAAPTEERLYESIATREQQFSVTEEGPVLVPSVNDSGDVASADLSDDSTVERISDDELTSARANDDLLVLSDPTDPDSDIEGVNLRAGNRLTQEEYETDPEAVAEPSEPVLDDDGNLVPAAEVAARADQAAIEEAKSQRDNADSVEDADGPDASLAAAQARHDAQSGDPGDSGNGPEVVQPEAGAATDASDSEQQEQVLDSEAAESDTERTNTETPGDKPAQSQAEITGPDSDSVEALRPPNAGQGDVPAGTGQHIDPNFVGDAEQTGPDGVEATTGPTVLDTDAE
jgi:hypothetical protein